MTNRPRFDQPLLAQPPIREPRPEPSRLDLHRSTARATRAPRSADLLFEEWLDRLEQRQNPTIWAELRHLRAALKELGPKCITRAWLLYFWRQHIRLPLAKMILRRLTIHGTTAAVALILICGASGYSPAAPAKQQLEDTAAWRHMARDSDHSKQAKKGKRAKKAKQPTLHVRACGQNESGDTPCLQLPPADYLPPDAVIPLKDLLPAAY